MNKVFINSFPKAGTNMVSKCLELLGYKQIGHIGANLVLGNNVRSIISRFINLPIKRGYLIGIVLPVEVSRISVDRLLSKVKDGEFVTAHVGYTEDVLYRIDQLKFKRILVLRDPRAIVASTVPWILKQKSHPFHHLFASMINKKRYQAAYRGCTDNRGGVFQSMRTRCLSIEPWLNSKNTLVVKFEDLVGHEGGGTKEKQTNVLIRLCQHVGVSERRIEYVKNNLWGPGKYTFRKGKIDSWRDEIPQDLQAEISHELKDILVTWGYEP